MADSNRFHGRCHVSENRELKLNMHEFKRNGLSNDSSFFL